MGKPKKKKKISVADVLLKKYHDPKAPGSLGGVQRFAKAYGLPVKKAKQVLEKDLAYTLHKPRRRRFPTLPVVVGGLDDQWVADLIEVQPLAKYNKGIRYLLTVIDVLSKYAWVQPLKNKTGPSVVEALETIVEEGRKPVRLQTDKGKEFYNTTVQTWLKQQGIQHFSTEGGKKAGKESGSVSVPGQIFRKLRFVFLRKHSHLEKRQKNKQNKTKQKNRHTHTFTVLLAETM